MYLKIINTRKQNKAKKSSGPERERDHPFSKVHAFRSLPPTQKAGCSGIHL